MIIILERMLFSNAEEDTQAQIETYSLQLEPLL